MLTLCGAGVGFASAQSSEKVDRMEVVTKQFKYYTGKKLDPSDQSVKVFGGTSDGCCGVGCVLRGWLCAAGLVVGSWRIVLA